jgi:hypothetical protein
MIVETGIFEFFAVSEHKNANLVWKVCVSESSKTTLSSASIFIQFFVIIHITSLFSCPVSFISTTHFFFQFILTHVLFISTVSIRSKFNLSKCLILFLIWFISIYVCLVMIEFIQYSTNQLLRSIRNIQF